MRASEEEGTVGELFFTHPLPNAWNCLSTDKIIYCGELEIKAWRRRCQRVGILNDLFFGTNIIVSVENAEFISLESLVIVSQTSTADIVRTQISENIPEFSVNHNNRERFYSSLVTLL